MTRMKTQLINEHAIAELAAQLSRLVYGDAFIDGLTPAQWTALRFFSRANRFSRTVSAFAEFHATTKGPASQTVKSLVVKKLIKRTRSKSDGRSARLDLTANGQASLKNDPFEILIRAAGTLPSSTRVTIARALERMLAQVAKQRDRHLFGTCLSCKHLAGDGCSTEDKAPYQCTLVHEPLQESEIAQLCINFEWHKSKAISQICDGT